MNFRKTKNVRRNELVQSFMSGGQKIQLWFEVSDFDREIRKQKLCRDHPEWSELQVTHEIIRQAFLPKPIPQWLEKRMKEREDEERAQRASG